MSRFGEQGTWGYGGTRFKDSHGQGEAAGYVRCEGIMYLIGIYDSDAARPTCIRADSCLIKLLGEKRWHPMK